MREFLINSLAAGAVVAFLAYAVWAIAWVEVTGSRALCEAEHPGKSCGIVWEPQP